MDVDMNINEYVGEEKQEHSAATNISKEEHEMKKIGSSQEIHQQTQINRSSTDTHGFHKQPQEGAFKITTKGIILTLLMITAVSVLISLVAIVLSILSLNALDCRADLETKEVNLSEIIFHFNAFKADMEYSLEQVKIDTDLALGQLADNMSNLAIQLKDIKSVATIAEFNISQLSSQLDTTNNNIESVAATLKRNVYQLSTQLGKTNDKIISMTTTSGVGRKNFRGLP